MKEEDLRKIFSQNLKVLLSQEKLIKERKNQRFNHEIFCEEMNSRYTPTIDRTSVSAWINAKRLPRPIVIQNIGEYFNRDGAYMLTDHTSPLQNISLATQGVRNSSSASSDDPKRQELQERVAQLPMEKLESLSAFLDVLERS